MQQHSTVAPPVWNGPRIPTNLFPWQLQPIQNHPPMHSGNSGSHTSLRRTLSTPCRKRVSEYRSYFNGENPRFSGEIPRESSPLFSHETPCSAGVAKTTSSPIEIPDSPSSLSVITISSSSDEMEPSSLEASGIEPALITSTGNDYDTSAGNDFTTSAGNVEEDQEEGREQNQNEDNFDGFGDDEEEDDEDDDDCVVTSSFSVGSASPAMNDFSNSQHPGYNGNADDDDVVSSTTDMPGLDGYQSDHQGNDGHQGNDEQIHCSDTESADEKGDVQDDMVNTRNHRQRHSHQVSTSSRTRPSSLGVFSHYSTPNMQTAGTFISTALPYVPQQTLLVPGREQRCCVSDVYQEPVFLLPPAHTQVMQQPLFTGVNGARVTTGTQGHVPYTYVNPTSTTTGAFITPLSQAPGVLPRGNLQTPAQNGISMTGQSFPGQIPYTNQMYQTPVFGGLKTYNIVPNGSTGPYGPFVVNSSPTKGRLFFP